MHLIRNSILKNLSRAVACAMLATAPIAFAVDESKDSAIYLSHFAANNLTATIVDRFEGDNPAIKIDFDSAATEASAAWLSLATGKLEPFSTLIPPYVGAGARKFTAKLWVPSTENLQSIRFSFERLDLEEKGWKIPLSTLKPGEWNVVEFSDPTLGSIDHPLTNVRLKVRSKLGTKGEIYLASPTIVSELGASYPLLTKEFPLLTTGMEMPLVSKPERPLPTRDTIAMGGYWFDKKEWSDQVPEMAKFMQARFPEYDFLIAPVYTPPLLVAKRLPELPAGFFYQFQKAPVDSRYLKAAGVLPKNGEGKMLEDFSNSILATHPQIQAGLKADVDYAASLGINNFKQVDYVWPYFGGRWGYDDASVAAYREDLLGKDEGLNLLPGAGGRKAGTIHFWDYYEDYHGIRLTPADVGAASWQSYQPATEKQAAEGDIRAKKNLGLYVALYHYEWLRQAQRFGRWAKAHDGQHDFTQNPEDLGNGADYVYLTRLADAGVLYIEFFGSPGILHSAYLNLPMYVRAGKIAGKKVGLITEIGQCGHGEHYLDPSISYLYSYELAALGLQNYHNEWMEAPFKVMSDPKNAYHYDRFSSWMTQAFAFARAHREKTVRPDAKVISVSLRSTNFYMSSWITTVDQMDSFGPMLMDAHVDVAQTDPMDLPEILPTSDVLFYAPPANQARSGKKLEEWLRSGGKTLVTHSYIPVGLDDGQAQLAQGVENVEYRGEEHSYSEYLKQEHRSGAALLKSFEGIRANDQGEWLLPAASRAKVIQGNADHPRLSVIELPKGSRIVYLHVRPQKLTDEQKSQVANALIKLLNLPQVAVADSSLGDPVMAHRFSHGNTQVVSIWNRATLNKLRFYAGYGPHLLPDRGDQQFDPNKRPYPYRDPGSKCGVQIPVTAAGTYRIYGFLSDKEATVTVGENRLLPLTVEGFLAEQFYFAPDGPEFVKEISELRRHRAEVLPFLTDQPGNSQSAEQ